MRRAPFRPYDWRRVAGAVPAIRRSGGYRHLAMDECDRHDRHRRRSGGPACRSARTAGRCRCGERSRRRACATRACARRRLRNRKLFRRSGRTSRRVHHQRPAVPDRNPGGWHLRTHPSTRLGRFDAFRRRIRAGAQSAHQPRRPPRDVHDRRAPEPDRHRRLAGSGAGRAGVRHHGIRRGR